jgi:hypothetical protein
VSSAERLVRSAYSCSRGGEFLCPLNGEKGQDLGRGHTYKEAGFLVSCCEKWPQKDLRGTHPWLVSL